MSCWPASAGNNCFVPMKMLMLAYIWAHCYIGEFIAFIIGWNLILEFVIGVAIVAKGIAIYLDVLVFGDDPAMGISTVSPLEWTILSDYFDFLAFFIPILIAGLF